MPVSFRVLEGLDYYYLISPLGKGPLLGKFIEDLKPLINRCCLGTPLGVGL